MHKTTDLLDRPCVCFKGWGGYLCLNWNRQSLILRAQSTRKGHDRVKQNWSKDMWNLFYCMSQGMDMGQKMCLILTKWLLPRVWIRDRRHVSPPWNDHCLGCEEEICLTSKGWPLSLVSIMDRQHVSPPWRDHCLGVNKVQETCLTSIKWSLSKVWRRNKRYVSPQRDDHCLRCQ